MKDICLYCRSGCIDCVLLVKNSTFSRKKNISRKSIILNLNFYKTRLLDIMVIQAKPKGHIAEA